MSEEEVEMMIDVDVNFPVHDLISKPDEPSESDLRKLLNEHPTSPMILNDNGLLPIHIACFQGHFNCLKILVDVCEECLLESENVGIDGTTCLYSASQNGKEIVHLCVVI